mmetsp:Transcript_21156/g.56385  ORF Transcript_21156/g.56385 Transcript_21156/m.56385 type:complete len:347 (-) Transcript_21156:264-1304(-)
MAGKDPRSIHGTKMIKKKTDPAKGTSTYQPRYFTLDFDSENFYYTYGEKQDKEWRAVVGFSQIMFVRELSGEPDAANDRGGQRRGSVFTAGKGVKPESLSGFELVTTDRTMELRCESQEQVKEWISSLNMAKSIGRTRPSMALPRGPADHRVKVVLVGDSGVGKTSLAKRYCTGFCAPDTASTIGIDFISKAEMVSGTKLQVNVWDTAGQEKFNSLTSTFYRDAQIVLILFDCSNVDSFYGCKAWLQQVRRHNNTNAITMLVKNKIDLTDKVSSLAREFAQANKLIYAETSAVQDFGVQEAFVEGLLRHLETCWIVQAKEKVVQNTAEAPIILTPPRKAADAKCAC